MGWEVRMCAGETWKRHKAVVYHGSSPVVGPIIDAHVPRASGRRVASSALFISTGTMKLVQTMHENL
jgi:hypothetical protein